MLIFLYQIIVIIHVAWARPHAQADNQMGLRHRAPLALSPAAEAAGTVAGQLPLQGGHGWVRIWRSEVIMYGTVNKCLTKVH